VPNDGDAWTLALGEVRAYLGGRRGEPPAVAGEKRDLLERALAPAGEAEGGVGRFATLARTLGRRTGELHRTLGRRDPDPAFAPEPLSAEDRRAMVARARAMLEENLAALAARVEALPASTRGLVTRLLEPASRAAVGRSLDQLAREDLDLASVCKTRIHGDLHLGQVLVRGEDFVITDFEGEPARPLAERRAKSSPLRDVMGMVRSFDYAPGAALRSGALAGGAGWGRVWTAEVAAAYLGGYLDTVKDAPFIPRGRAGLAALCTFHQLEKVIYEIGYEANNRPDWVEIPVRGLFSIAGLQS
jgi:trehalose synthase-fused probable maltokinase